MLFGSGYLVAALGAALGAIVVPALHVIFAHGTRDLIRRIRAFLPRIVVGLVMIVVLLPMTRQGSDLIERLRHPRADVSGSIRLNYFSQGFQAFLRNPIIGYGPFNVEVTRNGFALGGHNSYIMPAYEYGLVYLVPFVALLVAMLRSATGLARRVTRSVDRAVAVGAAATVICVLVMGMLTEMFNGVVAPAMLWLLVGLATVWNHWLDYAPETPLVGPFWRNSR
jgi:O-antigen ligase